MQLVLSLRLPPPSPARVLLLPGCNRYYPAIDPSDRRLPASGAKVVYLPIRMHRIQIIIERLLLTTPTIACLSRCLVGVLRH